MRAEELLMSANIGNKIIVSTEDFLGGVKKHTGIVVGENQFDEIDETAFLKESVVRNGRMIRIIEGRLEGKLMYRLLQKDAEIIRKEKPVIVNGEAYI